MPDELNEQTDAQPEPQGSEEGQGQPDTPEAKDPLEGREDGAVPGADSDPAGLGELTRDAIHGIAVAHAGQAREPLPEGRRGPGLPVPLDLGPDRAVPGLHGVEGGGS